MSKQAHWRQPAKKRGSVLLLIACMVTGILGMLRHFEEVEGKYFPAQGFDEEQERMKHWTLIRVAGRALETQEWRVYDQLHQRGRAAAIDPDIVVLGIDDASMDIENSSALPEEIEKSRALQLMVGWPWSREVYAHVLDRLFEAGAKTAVIDLMFPAPSNSFPEGDAVFKAALDKYKGRVLIGADFVTAASGGKESASLSMPWDGLVPQTWPADERIAFVTVPADDDGVVRATRFFRSDSGEAERTLASFPAAVMRLHGRAEMIPLGKPEHIMRFSAPDAYAYYPVHDIFIEPLWKQNFADGAFFKDKTVFIGPAARQMQDAKETAVGSMLGVQVHAQALAALKRGDFLEMSPLWVRAVLLIVFVLAAFALVLLLRKPLWSMLILLGVIALGIYTQLWFFDSVAFVVPMTVPLLGWGLCGFVSITYDYLLERKQKEAFRKAITRYFSPDMAAEILRDPDDYYKALSGVNRTITILFSDVRGFTSMSETAKPDELVAQLNEYLEKMVEVVFGHRGSIDKFIGDAVMAVWGRLRDPSDDKSLNEEAISAVTTAVRMREELATLNVGWKNRQMQELAFGIGIHQGEAIVGNIGSTERMEFTAIGDTVNSAARLESATKQYGVDLIISDAVRHRVHDQFVCRSADLVKVKGKMQPLEIFTVQGRKGECDMAVIEIFENAIRLFRSGSFTDALAEFEKARATGLDDGLTAMYLERCQDMIATPPEAWDGVWTMTKK